MGGARPILESLGKSSPLNISSTCLAGTGGHITPDHQSQSCPPAGKGLTSLSLHPGSLLHPGQVGARIAQGAQEGYW